MELLRRMANAFGRPSIPEGMEDRIPPGQYVTPKMPVMTLSSTPRVSTEEWRLRIFGAVEQEQELDWPAFQALANEALVADFHCVTQWSRLDVAWEGVPASVVLGLVRPTSDATHVMLHCADRYTTNIDLAALYEHDVLFAHRQDGAPLPVDHGAPVRLVVPARYGWKSAKWVTGVELMTADVPGFWERNGYHMRADPWHEERFG